MRTKAERKKAHEAARAAAMRRHCTGDPNTCKETYHVPSAPEIPLCGIMGGECEREWARRQAAKGG